MRDAFDYLDEQDRASALRLRDRLKLSRRRSLVDDYMLGRLMERIRSRPHYGDDVAGRLARDSGVTVDTIHRVSKIARVWSPREMRDLLHRGNPRKLSRNSLYKAAVAIGDPPEAPQDHEEWRKRRGLYTAALAKSGFGGVKRLAQGSTGQTARGRKGQGTPSGVPPTAAEIRARRTGAFLDGLACIKDDLDGWMLRWRRELERYPDSGSVELLEGIRDEAAAALAVARPETADVVPGFLECSRIPPVGQEGVDPPEPGLLGWAPPKDGHVPLFDRDGNFVDYVTEAEYTPAGPKTSPRSRARPNRGPCPVRFFLLPGLVTVARRGPGTMWPWPSRRTLRTSQSQGFGLSSRHATTRLAGTLRTASPVSCSARPGRRGSTSSSPCNRTGSSPWSAPTRGAARKCSNGSAIFGTG